MTQLQTTQVGNWHTSKHFALRVIFPLYFNFSFIYPEITKEKNNKSLMFFLIPKKWRFDTAIYFIISAKKAKLCDNLISGLQALFNGIYDSV